jgi:methylthioribose-1-phosphate isomerase
MAMTTTEVVYTLKWMDDVGGLSILDQTLLPEKVQYDVLFRVEDVYEAIKSLKVRGAPAIGVAAAYGVVLAAQTETDLGPEEFREKISQYIKYLAASRPTAVNLFWALDRMEAILNREEPLGTLTMYNLLKQEANAIYEEDRKICQSLGEIGIDILRNNTGILTHCNAGRLATAGLGTALAPIYVAHARGMLLKVFADETRPLLQGSRLTAWELQKCGVDVTVMCDSMAAHAMEQGKIQTVLVGADRILANGDVFNKIGTYGVSLLAKAHNIPLYVVAPKSTFDLETKHRTQVRIEHRKEEEVSCGMGKRTAPKGVKVYNPAFDVTPASLVTGIITEYGIISPVNEENIRQVLKA